ncbi:hypothetical protein A6C57_00250 [Fibrella sp. ES10-3-2-2]|nr:hypothetical protein A6C57_00250 [Fibrella sp. ES10-3-2-2]
MAQNHKYKKGDVVGVTIDSPGTNVRGQELLVDKVDGDALVLFNDTFKNERKLKMHYTEVVLIRAAGTSRQHTYKLQDKVTHVDLFANGYFTVVGVRPNELELRGDYSGGTVPDQVSWVPIEKIHPYKPEHFVRPPHGLMDRKYIDQQRQQDINEAIKRYLDAGRTVPGEWLEEYNEIVARNGARKLRRDIQQLT